MSITIYPEDILDPCRDKVGVRVVPGRFLWHWELWHCPPRGNWSQPIGRGLSGWATTQDRAVHRARRRVMWLENHQNGPTERSYWEDL